MTLIVLSGPAVEPVSVEEAKAHLRVTHDAEDALIARLITAARERVEAELGVALITTSFRETLDGPDLASGPLRLARGPLVAVAGAASGAGALFTPLAPALYVGRSGSRPAAVDFASVSLGRGASLRVDYTAGFGATADAVPATLRQAVTALASYAFEHRADGEAPLSTAEPWLKPWRRVRL